MTPVPASIPMRSPTPLARRLGVAGLLPFVGLAVATGWFAPPHDGAAAAALLAYGSSILAFLGAIHWGLAMRADDEAPALAWAWGVVPGLLAWLALLCAVRVGLGVLAVALWACWGMDRLLYPRVGMASWLGLRLGLTAVASACCLAAAVHGP